MSVGGVILPPGASGGGWRRYLTWASACEAIGGRENREYREFAVSSGRTAPSDNSGPFVLPVTIGAVVPAGLFRRI